MSPTSSVELTDGSSTADAHPLTRINRDDPVERYRFRCPNNHTSWDKTNGGIWCHSCARQGLDPHYHELHDAKSDEMIPWSAIELTLIPLFIVGSRGKIGHFPAQQFEFVQRGNDEGNAREVSEPAGDIIGQGIFRYNQTAEV